MCHRMGQPPLILNALRGAEAPLFHVATGGWAFFSKVLERGNLSAKNTVLGPFGKWPQYQKYSLLDYLGEFC